MFLRFATDLVSGHSARVDPQNSRNSEGPYTGQHTLGLVYPPRPPERHPARVRSRTPNG